MCYQLIIKKIVEEVIGNDDPFWNQPVLEVVKKNY